MNKYLATATLASVVALPAVAEAAPVTFTTTMKNYGGPEAYMVMYVTDASGAYQGSLWMSGGRAKYYRDLRDWARATGANPAEVDGITGASVGSGRTLKVTLDLSDALFNAGYQLHIDTAVENMGSAPSEVVVPLDSGNTGKAVSGRRFVQSFSFDM
ncbi:DUF2271 domain-containing protein [Cohaesibacter haloalkalitolerans]|uniref:DUF2271 domain-containing protein n=1 Tax=Cohaesibacter haloalkalitolerans TaxID=1162980 RepID=UPI000E647254|nr:DUF2271 domain-containing protein [Cohaesibacter haloalkalitolerans]